MTGFVLNPYAPAVPLEPQDESADESIQFGGAVQWDDIERFGRSGMGVYAGVLAWSTTIVLYLAVFWLLPAFVDEVLPTGLQRIDALPRHSLLIAACIAQGAVCTLVTMRLLGYLYARSSIAAAPDLLGSISGMLRAGSLELVYPHARKLLPLSSISELRRAPTGIGLILGDDRMSLIVLPRRLFDDQQFVKARDRISAALGYSEPLTTPQVDPNGPLPDELQRPGWMVKPDDADTFANGVLLNECRWTPAYHGQVARIYGFYGCMLSSVMMIFLPTAIFSPINIMRWHVFAVVVGMVVLFLLVHIVAAFWRYWTIRSAAITHLCGSLTSDGLTINSPIGSTTYQRAAFDRVVCSERSAQLILPGQHQRTLVLSKPMFESATGFERLRRWATN